MNKRKEYKTLNFASSELLKYNQDVTIDANTIPTLIPEAAKAKWIKEENPPYKVQVIDYPIKANGTVYGERFFVSFLENNKIRPFPGSANGHTYAGRGKTDLLMVGGKIERNGDGTGKVYFKNYILPENTQLRLEAETNMIHFSLVSYVNEELKKNEDGEYEWHALTSEGGERNDVVDYGAGAMQQKTNNAAGGGEQTNQKRKTMKKSEILKALQLSSANKFKLNEIAAAMGESDKLVTPEHIKALEVVKKLNEMGYTDPVKALTDYQSKDSEAQKLKRNQVLDHEFGALKENIGGQEKVNLLREYAGRMIGAVPEMEFTQKLNEFKNDPIALDLAQKRAAYNSSANSFMQTEPGKQPNAFNTGGVVTL